MLDASEHLVGLLFLAYEHAHELHPFSLSQRIELLIAQVWHQGDVRFADGIISAPLRG